MHRISLIQDHALFYSCSRPPCRCILNLDIAPVKRLRPCVCPPVPIVLLSYTEHGVPGRHTGIQNESHLLKVRYGVYAIILLLDLQRVSCRYVSTWIPTASARQIRQTIHRSCAIQNNRIVRCSSICRPAAVTFDIVAQYRPVCQAKHVIFNIPASQRISTKDVSTEHYAINRQFVPCHISIIRCSRNIMSITSWRCRRWMRRINQHIASRDIRSISIFKRQLSPPRDTKQPPAKALSSVLNFLS